MYTILINDDNTMTTTVKERIVQRSKLVDELCFLVRPDYHGVDMGLATVLMEYLTPVSKRYRTEILVVSSDLYKEHLMYTLPVDTKITEEAGDVEVQLSFIFVDLDANGKSSQRVRKTAPAHKITIVPISAWSDIIPDSALSALDQRIIKMDAQMRAIEDMNKQYSETKADNIRYDDNNNRLQLMAGEKAIGDVIQLKCDNDVSDGVPVVDFSSSTDFVTPDDIMPEENVDNVVEF